MYQKILAVCLLLITLGLGSNAEAYVFDHNQPEPYAEVYPNELPDGNYLESCQECHINRSGNLSCLCPRDDEALVPAVFAFDERCEFIENHNGRLVCTDWHHIHPHHAHYRQYDNGDNQDGMGSSVSVGH